MTTLPLQSIRIDGGTQTRAALNPATAAEYAEAMKDGAKFPPIILFSDGADNWLADGFHRVEAALIAGLECIDADIQTGTQRDAHLFALGANQTHGLRRTNDDKRQAVMTLLADREWGAWSDREIARHTGTSHPFVAGIRAKVETLPPKDHLAVGSAVHAGDRWHAFIVPAAGYTEDAFFVSLLRVEDALLVGTKRPVSPSMVKAFLRTEEAPAGFLWSWRFEKVSDESDENEFFPLDRRWSWSHAAHDSKRKSRECIQEWAG